MNLWNLGKAAIPLTVVFASAVTIGIKSQSVTINQAGPSPIVAPYGWWNGVPADSSAPLNLPSTFTVFVDPEEKVQAPAYVGTYTMNFTSPAYPNCPTWTGSNGQRTITIHRTSSTYVLSFGQGEGNTVLQYSSSQHRVYWRVQTNAGAVKCEGRY